MAVAYNSDVNGWGSGTASTSVTNSWTVAAGATALIVGSTGDGNTDFNSGCTYNGNAVARQMQQLQQYSALFGKIAAAAGADEGAHNLVVTFGTATVYGIGAFSVTGSHASSPFGTPLGAASAGSVNNSQAISTASANNLVVDVTSVNSLNSVTSTQTQRWSNGHPAGNNHWGSGSTAAGTGGSVTMGYTFASQRNSIIAMEVLQAAAGGATYPGADGCGVFYHDFDQPRRRVW